MVSGIHYNFQLDDILMQKIAEITGEDIVKVKNDVYLKTCQTIFEISMAFNLPFRCFAFGRG